VVPYETPRRRIAVRFSVAAVGLGSIGTASTSEIDQLSDWLREMVAFC